MTRDLASNKTDCYQRRSHTAEVSVSDDIGPTDVGTARRYTYLLN